MKQEKKKKRPAYSPEYYQANKERLMESQRKCRLNPKNRERYLEDAKRRSREWYSNPENRKRRYGYNQESWKRQVKKLEEKAGRKRPIICEICEETGRIAFDHDHKTGNFRGWICTRCNTVLGKCEDNKIILEKLISYLSKFDKS